ncbi:MAG: hypothetical protein KF771_12295 [Burkholderiales bacterium]|nr:hypothetical protein [Burkholderiales bacterium]
MNNDTPEFTAAAIRLSRVFFVVIGGVFLLLATAFWITGGQTYVGATAALATTGFAVVAFAVLASAQVCASIASKVLGLVGIPL